MVKSTLTAGAQKLAGLFQALTDKDRKRACAFERRADRRLHAGRYRDVEQFQAEAEKALLVPRAIDTQKLLDFIKGLVEIMKELIPLFLKT